MDGSLKIAVLSKKVGGKCENLLPTFLFIKGTINSSACSDEIRREDRPEGLSLQLGCKQVFWGAGVELPGFYGLSGSYEQG